MPNVVVKPHVDTFMKSDDSSDALDAIGGLSETEFAGLSSVLATDEDVSSLSAVYLSTTYFGAISASLGLITSVAGRTGDVVLSAGDLSNVDAVGQGFLLSRNPETRTSLLSVANEGFKTNPATVYVATSGDNGRIINHTSTGTIFHIFPASLTYPFRTIVSNKNNAFVTLSASAGRTVQGVASFTSGTIEVVLDGNDFRVLSWGEQNTTSNAGVSGEGIAKPKSGADLPLKKLVGGLGIEIAPYDDYLLIYDPSYLESETLTYVGAVTGISKTNMLKIDDTIKMLKGLPPSDSITRSNWIQLTANRFTNLKACWILASDYNASVNDFAHVRVAYDLKMRYPLSGMGGANTPSWGSRAVRFSGTSANCLYSLSGAMLSSGQFSVLAVVSNPYDAVGQETIAAQFENGAAGRTTYLMLDSASASLACFRTDVAGVSPSVFLNASQNEYGAYMKSYLVSQDSTNLKLFKNGSNITYATSAYPVSTVPQQTIFRLGNTGAASTQFVGTMSLVMVWTEDISSEYNKINSNLNNILTLNLGLSS